MTKEELRANAEYAIKKLNQYRTDYKQGKIDLTVLKLVAKSHIEMYDKYAKLKAKEHKVAFKPFSLIGFIR